MSRVPSIVHDVLHSPGRPLDPATRAFMEPRFGHDFSRVRVHTGAQAAESAAAVNARAYTVGQEVVFGAGEYSPSTPQGQRLMAHELTHTLQQATNPAQGVTEISDPGDTSEREATRIADQVLRMPDQAQPGTGHHAGDHEEGKPDPHQSAAGLPAIQRQVAGEGDQSAQANEEEGFEVGGDLMLLPRWHVATVLPANGSGGPVLQRDKSTDACHMPTAMRAVISGKFEGGKTLDDYFPDLVGKGFWGKNDTAGTFDNGTRAGSSVQLIGEYPSPCVDAGKNFTLGQTATIVRARANGKKMMENGKPLEGQTIDDIKRSGRDQSKPPFRQEFGFAVSMADPISGIPYNTLTSYEWEVNLTTSLTGKGGSKSVNWGVTVEASGGKVTKNEVR
jgi:hypothetical protein